MIHSILLYVLHKTIGSVRLEPIFFVPCKQILSSCVWYVRKSTRGIVVFGGAVVRTEFGPAFGGRLSQILKWSVWAAIETEPGQTERVTVP